MTIVRFINIGYPNTFVASNLWAKSDQKVAENSRNFVLFITELFLFHQPDDEIDHWCVGADCAGWFYARLLAAEGIQPSQEPVMEDWGWTFDVSVGDTRLRINVWAYFGIENCWLLEIEPKKRFFRKQSSHSTLHAKESLRDALDNLLADQSRFSKHRWLAESPFDLDVRSF